MTLPAFDKPLKIAAVLTALCACLLFQPRPARAQAGFVESFDNVGTTSSGQDGPQNLISKGWSFRNQSSPKGATSWHNGYTPQQQSFWPSPQAGAGYVAVEGTSTDYFGGKVSNWAILPQISGQRAGDTLTFYALNMDSNSTPTLQVRYSPNGGTSTGSGADAVGDFTQLLLDINPLPAGGWNRYSVTLPGSGRIALRYYIERACNYGCASSYTGIDTLSVGAPPPAACNLPPVPSAGQTVTWTAARSPYQVCQNIGIPPGSTVNVEAGVRVNFDSQRQLVVNGTLNIQGTATARVAFNSTAVYPPIVDAINGTVNATFADFGGQFYVETGSNVTLSDCLFAGLGYLRSQDIPAVQPFVKLDRCTFDHSGMALSRALVRLRNNTFNNSYALINGGFADVTAPNTFIGQPLHIDREGASYAQGLYVDGVNASGVVDGGGLQLSGGNYLLGPANVLQSNLFPLRVEGGLVPESKVPTTGNTNNAIDVNTGGFPAISGRWPNFGIPYRITKLSGDLPGGNLTIDPGVTVEADQGTWFLFRSTRRLIADGLPGQPITFKGTVPGRLWKGLTFATNATEGPRLEYCRVSDAEFGTVSTDNLLYVQNCDFQNNQVGANANTFGWTIFGKTRFLSNSTGAEFTDQGTMSLNDPTNPNSFTGNTRGIDAFEAGSSSDARNVWWGSPTGPRAPQNPNGTGDPIVGIGADGVLFKPFLTSPPNQTNTPPVVRMVEPGLNWAGYSPPHDYLVEPGTKYVIRWDVKDTDTVVKQRILFSPDGHYPDRFVVVADNLPGDQRSYEWTLPDPGFAVGNQPQFLRVVAVDAAGQEGWDQTPLLVPLGRITGEFTITTNLAGKTFYAGDPIPNVDWTGSVSDFPVIEPFVIFESDGAFLTGVYVNGHGEFVAQRFPAISTDRARLAVRVHNNGNDVKWFFASGYFSVRHDPRLGLVPPTVQLLTPAAGASYSAGQTVPITWSASDDQGLYSFDVQASYDAGRTWHVVVRDLPATARSYDWQLPPGGDLGGVRIRVVARDIRFQNNASDGAFGTGGGQTPVTAPAVTTAAAASVTSASATLRGAVNPQGNATDAWFEWSTSQTLSTYNTTAAQAVGSGSASASVSQGLSGLSPGTTYYFRAAAANDGGTTRGSILSFKTAATTPSLRVNNATVTETNTGVNTTAAFTVTLSAASSQTVTVKYETANVSATAPADYTALAPATLTFAPGQTSRTVNVTVRGDTLDEANETFRLLLSNPTGATIVDGTGTGTITDNDAVPTISITNATVTEPDTGSVNAVFTVTLSAPSARSISVKYQTADGTAAAGTDYTARALTALNFSAGQTSKTITVSIKGDRAREANETFFVNLSAPVNATISDAQGLGTITNDD
ncbi:MAG TPA: Calx-beta domain-containing protein [Pyrinomonadaceae bacterium]|nr:Calx-beta domain-containing protein [Pyrinomonadaceae bacterium]